MSKHWDGSEKDRYHLIFEWELCLLNDPAFVSPIKETMERTGLHSEPVLAKEITRLREKAAEYTDPLTIKSLIAMQDLYYRLLYNILPINEEYSIRLSLILQNIYQSLAEFCS